MEKHEQNRKEWLNSIDLINDNNKMSSGIITLYGTVGDTIIEITGRPGEYVVVRVKHETYLCKVDPNWFFHSREKLIAHRAKYGRIPS